MDITLYLVGYSSADAFSKMPYINFMSDHAAREYIDEIDDDPDVPLKIYVITAHASYSTLREYE